MPPKLSRTFLKIFGGLLVAATIALLYFTRKSEVGQKAALGEEVYASHDCSDCHLPVHVLRQKREIKEAGLIRVRRDIAEVVGFLEKDTRHRSFVMISTDDRNHLIEYLKTLLPR